MIQETFKLAQLHPDLGDSSATLTAYARDPAGCVADNGARWGVLILPGGGYSVVAPGEGEPVALAFLAAGMQAFVLNYSVAPARWPQAFLETAAALAFLRQNAARYGISPYRIAVCGFSAGGHLAGCLANLWCDPLVQERLSLAPTDVRPDAAILCYPVISAALSARGSSFPNLLGPDWQSAGAERLSLETSVTLVNPPTFLWCTWEDGSVPMENTLCYAQALRQAAVPFDLHIFQHGPHAMGLATPDCARDPDHHDLRAAQWHPLCVSWLRRLDGELPQ
jgi:acetyl esterase/lipase